MKIDGPIVPVPSEIGCWHVVIIAKRADLFKEGRGRGGEIII
jgi:hypothetical protein